jgi:imidazolonepropionase-like amidohydrolase
MLLKNLRVWTGEDATYSDVFNAIRILEDGTFEPIQSDEVRPGELAFDCQGLTALPGLIDAHVHLGLDPEVTDPFAHGKLPESVQLEAMRHRTKMMLLAGITTARDLGGGAWLELTVRDEIRSGKHRGTRLLCAGQPLTSRGGHCHFWGGEATTLEEALAVLDRQHSKGVDLIKIMATGGSITPGSQPADAQFDQTLMDHAVNHARALGYEVAAHCHGVDGIRHAAHAGVTTIEHCSWVGPSGWGKHFDADLAAKIAAKGIWVSPTVNLNWRRHLENPEGLAAIQARFGKMKQAGCRFVASTDAGIPNVFHADLPKTLDVFSIMAELSPAETLTAATRNAAEALGVSDQLGRIKKGLSADLILVEGDPLTSLQEVETPVEVFLKGHATLGLFAK